ncbi:histidine kinase [Streptomyces diastaticus]|uniref:sensor histidine kinase n=1 Tax=Streptomyces diastaticus TaxID=1956 RepID=UPI0036AF2220
MKGAGSTPRRVEGAAVRECEAGDECEGRRGLRARFRLRRHGAYAFLPWLILGAGALSHLVQGATPNPWLGGVHLLVFNALYTAVVFRAFDELRRTSRSTLYLLGAMGVATYLVALMYGGSWLMFIPLLSLACGTVLRGRRLIVLLAVLSASGAAIAAWEGDLWNAVSIGYGTYLSGLVTATILSLSRTVVELHRTRQELARTAVERERLRFSRDLHDLLGHTLSVVVVKAEAARRLVPHDAEAAGVQMRDIEEVGRHALTEVREAVSGYREESVGAEIERARSLLETAGIAVWVDREGPPLPPRAEALLSWVVWEAATNVVRHSGASRCRFAVSMAADGTARLRVTDDGRGEQEPDGATGSGLAGLAERLGSSGGRLRTGPGPDGRGFTVVAELPVFPVDVEEAAAEERAVGQREARTVVGS